MYVSMCMCMCAYLYMCVYVYICIVYAHEYNNYLSIRVTVFDILIIHE